MFRRSLALGLVLVSPVLGCSRHGEGDEGERPAGALSSEGPSPKARNDRIPTYEGEAIGVQPGYLEGAIIHASVELGAVHEALRHAPIDAELQREIDEFAAAVANPLGETFLASLGLSAEARLSMSVRPVATWESELRLLVERPSDAMTELLDWRSARLEASELPEPSPAALELDRKIKSLGVHVRVDLPVAKPALLRPVIERVATELSDSRWAATCETLGPVLACGGKGDGLLVIRERPGGIVLDLLSTFRSDYDAPDDRFRRAAIKQALKVPTSTPPAVAGLRGDFGLALDGPGLSALIQTADLARTLSYPRGSNAVDRFEEREAALRQLRGSADARVFEGVMVEGKLGADHLDAALRWRVRSGAGAGFDSMFALSEVDADVPSIAALCEGALICARSRGVPTFGRFSDLATGVYADPERLSRLIDRYEDEAAAVLMLETWPNALAALGRLPNNAGPGASAFMIENALGVVGRVLGFGLSIRSIDELERGFRGDWLAYARLSSADLATLTSFLQLAEVPITPTSIPEVSADVGVAPIPERDIGGNIYTLTEPAASTGAWGWAVLADADDRVRWFAGLAHDDGATPLVYVELGDLWRIVAAMPELARELGFAREWLARRWVRAQVERGGADSPVVVRVAMGKRG